MLQLTKPSTPCRRPLASVEESYEICRRITADYAKTFYLGTLLMPPAKRKAIWAIYVWCRHTDELVDGPKAATTTLETLDLWEQQLESVFAGVPVEDADVALVDTLQQFPLEIQPFRDMIEGQRMDLYRSRYQTFEELNLYCYRVAGTVGLMSTAVMGVEPVVSPSPWITREPYVPIQEAVALGIANQLTNILRDVGEDARRRGRIYLPLDELAQFNYTEEDLFNGVIDDRWRALMRFQLDRARHFYQEAEQGIRALSADGRWPVWASLMLYSQILDVIEANGYDVFNRRAYVPGPRKLLSLPVAWTRAIAL
jgi:15-cis-phytoene synthase